MKTLFNLGIIILLDSPLVPFLCTSLRWGIRLDSSSDDGPKFFNLITSSSDQLWRRTTQEDNFFWTFSLYIHRSVCWGTRTVSWQGPDVFHPRMVRWLVGFKSDDDCEKPEFDLQKFFYFSFLYRYLLLLNIYSCSERKVVSSAQFVMECCVGGICGLCTDSTEFSWHAILYRFAFFHVCNEKSSAKYT